MFGITFAENIIKSEEKVHKRNIEIESTECIARRDIADDKGVPGAWRKLTIKLMIIGGIGILLTHIFTLQIIRGKYFQGKAEGNRIIQRMITAPRGVIVDAENTVLARNVPYVKVNNQLITYKEYIESKDQMLADGKTPPPIVPIREYIYPEECAHIIGYISPITQEELNKNKKLVSHRTTYYTHDDIIGRAGLESAYETILRGKEGTEILEVDGLGNMRKMLAQKQARAGYTVKTAIRSSLQKYAFEKLKQTVIEKKASSATIVIQDPNNGAIITMVSYPSYDTNAFTNPQKSNVREVYLRDTNAPLLNRAISGVYPPGSTFKIITALAGLETKKITEKTMYEDTGSITIAGVTFNNWYFTQYGKGEGLINVKKALARSNDTFFYKMALDTGVEGIIEEAYKFKMGKVLGVDIPGEASGLIPTPEWKQKVKKEMWFPGDTVNMSIGQGDVLTTPLQINQMTMAIANYGKLYTPHIVTEIADEQNNTLCKRNKDTGEWIGEICQELNKNIIPLSLLPTAKENITIVREGMKMAAEKGGTAVPFFTYKIQTGGKTGTAESTPGKPPHAWYTAFAPYDNPQMVMTVLIEHGGEGSQVAAPIAKEIMDYFFEKIAKNMQ